MTDTLSVLDYETKVKDQITKVILAAWSDKNFAAKLVSDTTAALQSIGVDFGDHIVPHFYLDSGQDRHFVIPLNPSWYIKAEIDYNLRRLAALHAEVTSSVSWVPVNHPTA